MGQRIVGVATLMVAGAILADLVSNYKATAVLVNGISGLWRNGLQAAAGQAVSS
jgi:hypothetical protein